MCLTSAWRASSQVWHPLCPHLWAFHPVNCRECLFWCWIIFTCLFTSWLSLTTEILCARQALLHHFLFLDILFLAVKCGHGITVTGVINNLFNLSSLIHDCLFLLYFFVMIFIDINCIFICHFCFPPARWPINHHAGWCCWTGRAWSPQRQSRPA